MSNPNYPEGVTEKDIDGIGESTFAPTYQELKDDLEESEAKCLRLWKINRDLADGLNDIIKYQDSSDDYIFWVVSHAKMALIKAEEKER